MLRTSSLLAGLLVVALSCRALHGQEVSEPTSPTENSPSGIGGAAPPTTAPRLRAPGGEALPSGEVPMPGAAPQLMPDPIPNQSYDKPQRGAAVPPEPPKPRSDRKIGTSKTEVFSQEVAERIRMRQVETRALADANVQAEWERSVAARTFPEKRAALKQYYKLLFTRMTKLDSTLKVSIEKRAAAADASLTQKFAPADALNDTDRSTSGRVFAD